MRGVVLVVAGVLATGAAWAAERGIPDATPLFCRDSTQTFQPFVNTDYGRLQQGFVRQFGWRAALNTTSETMGVLSFTGGTGERIFYDVEIHNGGLALLHMHVRLQGKREDLSGTPMCMQTFGIVNIR